MGSDSDSRLWHVRMADVEMMVEADNYEHAVAAFEARLIDLKIERRGAIFEEVTAGV